MPNITIRRIGPFAGEALRRGMHDETREEWPEARGPAFLFGDAQIHERQHD
jgi:hypothetical protein